MEFNVHAFNPSDPACMCIQEGQRVRDELGALGIEDWDKIRENGPCYTIWAHRINWRPVLCMGLAQQWDHCGYAWTIIDQNIGSAGMLYATRAVRKLLDHHNPEPRWRRIWTTVQHERPEQHRWMDLLGFSWEGQMSCYDAAGHDYDLYARIHHGSRPASSSRDRHNGGGADRPDVRGLPDGPLSRETVPSERGS